MASSILAADAGVKAAHVDIIEIRCATGLGGKSFLYLTGDVDSVRAAVEAAVDVLEGTGLILRHVVIPSPTDDISRSIL